MFFIPTQIDGLYFYKSLQLKNGAHFSFSRNPPSCRSMASVQDAIDRKLVILQNMSNTTCQNSQNTSAPSFNATKTTKFDSPTIELRYSKDFLLMAALQDSSV